MINVKTIIDILLRRKWVILVIFCITVAVVVAGTFIASPTYTATASVRVATSASNLMNYSDYIYADRIINTYIRIATSGPIFDELKKRLSLTILPDIQVQTIPTTELIQITVDAGNPALAADTANMLATLLVEQSGELYSGSGKKPSEILSEQIAQTEVELLQAKKAYADLLLITPPPTTQINDARQALDVKQNTYDTLLNQYAETKVSEAIRSNIISIVDPAELPLKPSKPNKPLYILLGGFVGMIGGLGIALIFENVDTTLHSTQEVKTATDLSILAEIPIVKDKNNLDLEKNSITNEAFRRLRTTILITNQYEPIRTLLVTSAQQREGKSFVVAGLAIAIAQSGKKVCVVDADMRLPTQHSIFELSNDYGLSNSLEQGTDPMTTMQESEFPGLSIIPSGPMPAHPTGLLGSQQMTSLLQTLADQFDFVLVDSPALLAVADAVVLAPMVDAAVLVVGREIAHEEAVLSAKKQLEDVKTNLVGVIVNRTDNANSFYYYYHHRSNGRHKSEKINPISLSKSETISKVLGALWHNKK